jgi:hypothetical protein
VIIIQACVSRPQTAPPSQGAGPMGGILWRYGAKGGPYGLLLLLLYVADKDMPNVERTTPPKCKRSRNEGKIPLHEIQYVAK